MQTAMTPSCATAPASAARAVMRPAYEVNETASHFEIAVTLPGVNKEDVHISLEKGQLEVRAAKTHALPAGWKVLHRETHANDYHLALALNVDVDEARIGAVLENGVLTLTLPKAEEVRPRRIDVK